MPDIFHSIPDTCEYIPSQNWRQMVFWLKHLSPKTMDTLLELGFRHFGFYFFRNDCLSCNLCKGIRVDVEEFALSKSQKRLCNINSDLSYTVNDQPLNAEDRQLISRWQSERESSRNWNPHPFSEEEFLEAFAPLPLITRVLRVFDTEKKLVGISILDKGIRFSNSIYAAFCPDQPKRSIGTYLGIKEIEWAKEQKLTHHFFGHYNPDCPSLSYKSRFKPNQISDYEHLDRNFIIRTLQALPEWNDELQNEIP